MVAIRLAQDRDASTIATIYAPIVLNTPISFEFVAPNPEEMLVRIHKTIPQYPWLVATEEDRVIGYAYASKHSERAAYQWAVNVSIYIHEDWRGRGIGRSLYTSLFAILRKQGYFRVYAGITLPNPGSVGIHEAMGMIPVGIYHQVGYKFGSWHNVGWWQGTLQEPPPQPVEPQALSPAIDP
jgi:L-amino acid N-acyltransferase YncA